MIGVNTFSASTVTMVNRRPVDYDTAVEIFEKLVTDRDNTVDPAIIPEGDIYEFDEDDLTESRRFYEDNSPNNKKPIYLIGTTNNRKESLGKDNEEQFDKLKNDGKNPLFGRWHAEGERFTDTCYVEVAIDVDRALELKQEHKQKKILEICNNGRWELI